MAQTAFIKGRCLLDGALALHEIIDELKSANHKDVILKLNFEKAYDRVSWAFLRSVLLWKGFDAAVVHRLMQLVSGGQTTISINEEVCPFFRNKRGVRQGDPISPLLFDFMADALSALLDAAARAGHLRGVVPHLIQGGVTHLQYADDTILLLDLDDSSIANLKFILIAFEILSGLKINYLKSEVIVMGASPSEQARVAQALNFKEGKFPFTYLGFRMSVRALRASPLTRPTRPPAGVFSSGRRKSAQSRPRILVFARIWAFIHPASPGHPRPSGARSGTPDERNAREKSGKIRARSHGSCGPDLSARVGGRRPHRLVFRASSSPHASSSARCKGCRRWPASHAARRVNASAAI
jgi:hypothetical protein